MRRVLAVVFVLLAACPVLGGELTTRHKTPVRQRPSKSSKVLAHLPANTKIVSGERKDFWFHVRAKLEDGASVSGWVHQFDVVMTMGRSKGQLIAENKRLFAELTALRETVKQLRQEAEERAKKNAALEEELAGAKADLVKARGEVERLKAEVGKTRPRN